MLPFPQKYLIAAGVLLAVVAWGGVGWYGKRAAELEHERYRGEQARLVVRQQEQIIAAEVTAKVKAREATDAYQKGRLDSDARWAQRLRHHPRAGGGPVPDTAGAPVRADGATCEERLHGALRQLDAVDRAARAVAEALRDAEHCSAQLEALQAFNCGR